MSEVMPTRIGLLDAMGYGNLGDAAIQDSVIANIRRRLPSAQIVGFSFAPQDTVKRHGIPCYPITRHAWREGCAAKRALAQRHLKAKIEEAIARVALLHGLARRVMNLIREAGFLARSYRTLRNLDVLIMSGGGQLCELWGGAWGHPFNLFKFSILTKLARKRLYFLNVGAEPLEQRMSRIFVRWAIGLADYVSFRDVYSRAQAIRLGIGGKSHVGADCAYALDATRFLGRPPSGASMLRVGINPIAYCDPRIWPRKDQPRYEAYLDKLTRFAEWLLENGFLITFFNTGGSLDNYAISDLKQRLFRKSASGNRPSCAAAGREGVVKEALCGSVGELLGQMARLDFILTSKYHGVIFSHVLRKPVIALSYQGKIDAAMQSAGLGEFSAAIEHFETDWLVAMFKSLVRNGKTIRAREASLVARYAQVLQEQFDQVFSSRRKD